jgi:methylated-DNA-[protein]-cysteine S-methyltransferase
MTTTHYLKFSARLGPVVVAREGDSLCGFWFEGQRHFAGPGPKWQQANDDRLLNEARLQFLAYERGERHEFELPMAPRGTEFQRQVWQALRAIPRGSTVSYRDLAIRLGRPAAMRAVGAAVGRNPLSVLVPCHRVMGSDGSLTGYAGGLARKQQLLELEGAI